MPLGGASTPSTCCVHLLRRHMQEAISRCLGSHGIGSDSGVVVEVAAVAVVLVIVVTYTLKASNTVHSGMFGFV